MKKIALISLGCVKNTVDSEAILALFKKPDFEIVTKLENSDVIIINTCGFILSAKIEGIDTILDTLKYGKKVVVIGPADRMPFSARISPNWPLIKGRDSYFTSCSTGGLAACC